MNARTHSSAVICLDAQGIKKVYDQLKALLKTDKIYAMGRAAEVLRGLFPTTHVVQFFVVDDTQACIEVFREMTWFPMRQTPQASRTPTGVASFEAFSPAHACVVYPMSVLVFKKAADFMYMLDQGNEDPVTGIKIPTFELNHAFLTNNFFYHEETTVVMESVNEYLQSSIGHEKDVPLIGEMHRFLALPESKRDNTVFMSINDRLLQHEHGELLSRVFKETSLETV